MLSFIINNKHKIADEIERCVSASQKTKRKSFFVDMASYIETKNEKQCKSRYQKKQLEMLTAAELPEDLVRRYITLKRSAAAKNGRGVHKQVLSEANINYVISKQVVPEEAELVSSFSDLRKLFSDDFICRIDNEEAKSYIKDFLNKLPVDGNSCEQDFSSVISSLYTLQPDASLRLNMLRDNYFFD